MWYEDLVEVGCFVGVGKVVYIVGIDYGVGCWVDF